MKILLTELLPEFEYFPQPTKKNQIVLHHTVSAVGKYVDDWFKADKGKSRIAVAYVIDKDGSIYELFNPKFWAYHIGKGSTMKDNQNSIGIEIVNEGILFKRSNGKFYWWIDSNFPEGRYEYNGEEVFELENKWRNEKYFANYTEKQVESVYELIEHLLQKFPTIKREVLCNFNYNKENLTFKGIVMHNNLRSDKTDLSPAFNIEKLSAFVNNLALKEVINGIQPKSITYIKKEKEDVETNRIA